MNSCINSAASTVDFLDCKLYSSLLTKPQNYTAKLPLTKDKCLRARNKDSRRLHLQQYRITANSNNTSKQNTHPPLYYKTSPL